MNVFDNEVEFADQATAQRCFMFAQAGLQLSELRAYESNIGTESVN